MKVDIGNLHIWIRWLENERWGLLILELMRLDASATALYVFTLGIGKLFIDIWIEF